MMTHEQKVRTPKPRAYPLTQHKEEKKEQQQAKKALEGAMDWYLDRSHGTLGHVVDFGGTHSVALFQRLEQPTLVLITPPVLGGHTKRPSKHRGRNAGLRNSLSSENTAVKKGT